MANATIIELEDEPLPPEPEFEEEELAEDDIPEIVLDAESASFVKDLIERIIMFTEEFCDVKFYPYQLEPAYRIIESIIIGDGEEITYLVSRQAGKTEALCDIIAALMVILPKLALTFPMLEKFRKGFWVGVFAPIDEQANTAYSRVVTRLTSTIATEIRLDPEIDDPIEGTGKGKTITLNSGSLCRRQTAAPKASIESKTYHFILIDECQKADAYVIGKSIRPMLAHYNGSSVLTGTPDRQKGYFYNAIQRNKRQQCKHGRRRKNHFEYDHKVVSKYNPNYRMFVAKEKARLTEESDEFQLSYAINWLLDRGMFVVERKLDRLGDPAMGIWKYWTQTPVVVGIDPARTTDSTVVTVVYVDWERVNGFGLHECRVLNWLEIQNSAFEQQYFEIRDFLKPYRIWKVAVDSTGMGLAVAERMALLLPRCEVVPMSSVNSEQDKRWRHLKKMVDDEMILYPAHGSAKRTKVWQRFHQQMIDLERTDTGPYMLAAAPDAEGAHDDFPDSLALACYLTGEEIEVAEVEVVENVFYEPARR